MDTDTWPVRIFIFALDHNNNYASSRPALRYNIRLPDPAWIGSLDHLREVIYAAVLDASVPTNEPIADRRRLSGMTIEWMSALTVHAGESIHLTLDGDNFRSVVMQLRMSEGVLLSVKARF